MDAPNNPSGRANKESLHRFVGVGFFIGLSL